MFYATVYKHLNVLLRLNPRKFSLLLKFYAIVLQIHEKQDNFSLSYWSSAIKSKNWKVKCDDASCIYIKCI